MAPYYDDFTPGEGRRTPRADALSDAPRLSLNGHWRFRLSPTASGTGDAFTHPDFDDSAWDTIPVPSHWVLEGHGHPLYTNTAFPFPIDPPYVPTDNPTGEYRLDFELPEGWRADDTVLRFQGVDSCGKVWLNGHELGHSKGSRLPFEFEVGQLVHPGSNSLAVRVHRWSSGSYLEDQDMWWLPGIFRDVELLARPAAAIDDYFVHATYDAATGMGTLVVDATSPGVIDIPELDVRGLTTGDSVTIPVAPWSAELPRLYRGTLRATGAQDSETIELAVGFRTVSIVDGRLLVNGEPVLFRGVNRHEQDPDVGRALSVDTMRRDILLMKQNNINAVRTSHYPPHPEFLRLCDELGLWVVEECDIETHGFIYAGWEGNPPADPRWRDALLDRIRRMVERDKNRPSVVVWSMANESWTGDTFGELERWIRERDDSRPVFYERDPSYQNSDFYSLMYPSLEDLEAIGRREETTPDGIEEGSAHDIRRRALPFLLCEYAHAMGNGPGSLGDYQRILEAHDRFCGAFVWEWIDHGFRRVDASGREFFAHGGDIDFRPNGGRYCLDGLLFSDRTPSPGLAEYKTAIQPVGITISVGATDDAGRTDDADGADVTTADIRNKHDFRDLTHLTFSWVLETDGLAVSGGPLEVPPVAARSTVSITMPQVAVPDVGESWITITATLAEATAWAPAGHAVAFGQARVGDSDAVATTGTAPIPTAPAAPHSRPDGTIVLGRGVFDGSSGRLLRLGDLDLDGPQLDIWRAPTENDRGQGPRNTVAATWKAVGLDRMLHRTDSIELLPGSLVVTTRSAPAAHGLGLRAVFTWTLRPSADRDADADALHLAVHVIPEGIWTNTPIGNHTVTLPRLGLRLGLPASFDTAQWFGLGPDESYSDSRDAARVGRFTRTIDDLQTNYPVPEENGNHVDTRWLRLSASAGPGPTLRVTGEPAFDFTARRWTSEDLERARHPFDLIDTGRVWLNLDYAQRGVGSAACGPALPERYAVPPIETRFGMTLSLANSD
ncbi:glycoside hydrolase family 2 TIM barrel-domain containing protein [Glaciihabitans sp. dw_435]|uniref:glycoside hydrolase family 2 TIM barrel-domain containing protein n=1 Tax=Glaciihabitans sp. dw_435 TaxID=2720081 RepID=UPI001BD2BA9C|nr:glycoside hydrolase family 2 TIM barrel-domain containing protein [Glaciihabitans sp. dw_435]